MTDEKFGIGNAVKEMHDGRHVARQGWHGRDMWLELQPETGALTEPYVAISLPDGNMIPWTCSQADLLATDWMTVP